MKRKFIHLMAAIINETGINITDESLNSKVFRYLFITTPVIYAIFALFMYSYTNRENFYEVVSTATYIGGGTIAIAGVAIIFFHRKEVRQMLYQMDDNIFTYPDEHLIVVNYKWYLKEENGVSLYYLVMAIEFIGYSIICSTSVIEWIFYRDITFYVFPSWTPWKETSIKTRFATLISQHIMTLCGLYLYYIGLLFIMIITIEFNRQFERLKSAVRSIAKRTGAVTLERRNKKFIRRGESNEVDIFRDVNYLYSRFDAEFTTEFNEVFKKNLLNCIRHHQLLIKNHKLFQPLFKIIFSFELACCMMTFALGLYCILVGIDFQLILNLCGAAIIVNTNFFARCYIGEHFSRESTEIQNTIFYESQWHDQIIENRRLLLMFHQQARYSFDFHGFSIIKASLSTFASIIRSTYSLLNVIQASVSK